MTMQAWLVPAVSTIIGGCLTAGAVYGVFKVRVDGAEEQISGNSEKISKNRDQIDELRAEAMAEARHREAMRGIRVELEEIKTEVQAIREHLLATGAADRSDLRAGR